MGEMSGRIEILPDPPALARHVGGMDDAGGAGGEGRVSRLALRRLDAEGALTRCSLPTSSSGRFPWPRVSWYWGDERFVPHDHPESNYRMTREAMLAKAPVPPENIHPVPTDGTPDDAAVRYERTLQAAYGARNAGSGAADVRYHAARPRSRWPYRLAAAGRAGAGGAQALGRRRLAWPARDPHHHDLSGDREQPAVAFLVAGKEKASIFGAIRAGDSQCRRRASGRSVSSSGSSIAPPREKARPSMPAKTNPEGNAWPRRTRAGKPGANGVPM